MTVQDKVSRIKNRFAYQQGVKDHLTSLLNRYQVRLKEIQDLTELYNRTSFLLQKVSSFARQQVATLFEQMVTEALQTILETSTLQFKVYFIQKKNTVDVQFKLLDTTLQKELDIMHSFGGGVKDIVSTILRVLVLEMHKPVLHGPIVLDETGKNISKEYQANFGTFLQTLSQRLNRQIILVTHSPIIAQSAERIFTVKKNDTGKALVEATS